MIEMIVVVVMIGIIASVVAFSFTQSLSGARIQAASRDLVAALRYTRGQAIVKGEPLPQPGIPESFNVLLHELRGLALNVSLE